jgi:hypothetical protein
MKKIVRLTESDLTRIVKRVIKEEEEIKNDSLIKKIMRKLKGVSDKQLDYNIKNNLPWDWNGSKEGFYEKMEGRKSNTGSN